MPFVGVVARDENTNFVGVRLFEGPEYSPVEAEAFAVLQGFYFAIDRSWKMVIIESNCLEVVKQWNGGNFSLT